MKRYRVYLLAGACLATTLSFVAMAQQSVPPAVEIPEVSEVTVESAPSSTPRLEVLDEGTTITGQPAEKPVHTKPEARESIDQASVFTLKHAKAGDCLRVLKTLMKNLNASEDARTNSVIVVSTPSEAKVVQQLLLAIDSRPDQRSAAGALDLPVADAASLERGSADRPQPRLMELDTLLNPVEAKNSRGLTYRLIELNAKSLKLASEVRAGGPTAEAARKDLEATLSAALQVKFELEHLEIRSLEDRLNRVKSQYEKRAASTRQILERRLRELVEDDSTQWTTSQIPEKRASNIDPTLVAPLTAEPKANPLAAEKPLDMRGSGLSPRGTADPFAKSATAAPMSNYEEMATKLSAARSKQQEAERELANASNASNVTAATQAKANLQTAIDRSKIIADEYAATMLDLELQFESASQLLKLSEASESRLRQLHAAGAVSNKQFEDTEARLKQDRLVYDRLKVRFDLFCKLQDKFGLDSSIKSNPPVSQGQPPRPETVKPAAPVDPTPISIAAPPSLPGAESQPSALLNSQDIRQFAIQVEQIMSRGNNVSNESVVDSLIQLANRSNGSLRSETLELLIQSTKQFQVSTRTKPFLHQLREGTSSGKLLVLRCLSPLWDYASTVEFPPLVDLVFEIAGSENRQLKREALRLLAMTLPMTKANAPTFQTEERRIMVKQLAAAVPYDRVVELLKAKMKSSDIALALDAAQTASTLQKDLAESDVDLLALDVCTQVAKGQWQEKLPTSYQRYTALQTMRRFESRGRLVVPLLIELLRADKSDLRQNSRVHEFSRLQIIDVLQAFGPDAREALPILEDDLTLITSISSDQMSQGVLDTVNLLKKTIQSLKSSAAQVAPSQF